MPEVEKKLSARKKCVKLKSAKQIIVGYIIILQSDLY